MFALPMIRFVSIRVNSWQTRVLISDHPITRFFILPQSKARESPHRPG
jgi:hypothetical protein